jgi:MFS family permease
MTDSTGWRDMGTELVRGWPILLGALLGVAIGNAALPFYTAGVFVSSLETTFGWTRSDLALAGLIGTLTIVTFAPIVGAMIDRFGVRQLAVVGFAGVAGSFTALSFLQGSFAVYLAILVIGGMVGLASTPVAFTRIVNEHFSNARGLALGITLAGTGLTAALAPPLTAAFVVEHGWRAGFRALALTVVIGAPLVLLLLSRRSGPSAKPTTRIAAPLPTTHITLREALRVPLFRLLLAAFAVLALGVCGYVMHLIPMLTDAGVDITQAAAIQGSLGVAVIAGRVAVGALVDRFFAPRVAAIAVSFTALGMILLAVAGPAMATPAALAIGFALGAEVDLIGYLTARYFGMASYGRLYGLLYSAFVLGTGVSPLMIAWLQRRSGNYEMALYICAGLVALAAVLFLKAPPFPNQSAPAVAPTPSTAAIVPSR